MAATCWWRWPCWPWRSSGCGGRTRRGGSGAGGAGRPGRGLLVSRDLHGRRSKLGDCVEDGQSMPTVMPGCALLRRRDTAHAEGSCDGVAAWIVYNVVLVASFAAVLVVSKDSVGDDEPADDGRDPLGRHLPAARATAEVAAVAAGDPRRRDAGLSRRRAELGQHVFACCASSPAWPCSCDAGRGCSWACCWRRWG